ncbi:MAG: argininosuccinate lyase [Conexivisphaerales archaeon]
MSLLRGKRLSKMDTDAANFTSSVDQDRPLLKHVVKINIAHVLSLYKSGIIGQKETFKLVAALQSIPDDLRLDSSLEDVHMNVESYVANSAGISGGLINLGKSRNDQVSTALRMVVREEILGILSEILLTVNTLVNVAKGELDRIMPGYTHLQIAQPTTLAHYLACYAQALIRDADRLKDVYGRTNLSPMGSAAFAGSTVPLNRKRVAELLGFDGLLTNSMDAVSARDFLLEFLSILAITQIDLSRMAEDMIFYSTQESSYLTIPDEFASTSSMMPQKRNAVVLETIRAKAASLIGMFCSAASNIKGLPQSYNLDLQELNSFAWTGGDTVKNSLKLVRNMISSIRFNAHKLAEGANYGYSIATDLAEIICIQAKVPFRDAHHIVGAATSRKEGKAFDYRSFRQAIVVEALSRGYKEVENVLPQKYDASESVKNKKSVGSPNPIHVEKMLNELTLISERLQTWLNQKHESLNQSELRIRNEVKELEKEVRNGGV